MVVKVPFGSETAAVLTTAPPCQTAVGSVGVLWQGNTARRWLVPSKAWDLSVWWLYVLIVPVWVLFGFSHFLPQSKNTHVRKKMALGVCM